MACATLALQCLADKITLINPDDIAKQIQPVGSISDLTNFKAGKIAIAQQNKYLSEKKCFGMETTFSGKRELELMLSAKNNGYDVNFVYISLKSVTVAYARVKQRVRSGGHDVSYTDVSRRYPRSLKNLQPALLIADKSYVFSNDTKERKLMFSCADKRVRYLSDDCSKLEWANNALSYASEQWGSKD